MCKVRYRCSYIVAKQRKFNDILKLWLSHQELVFLSSHKPPKRYLKRKKIFGISSDPDEIKVA